MSKTRYCNMLAISLAAALQAAVPTEWQVRIGPRATVYQAERYHGDALALRATLTSGGAPLAYQGSARLYAQTNGMDALWWDLADVTVSNNVLAATWLPEYDTGADVVDMFLGAPSNYQAHARIRLLPSPGPAPNALPLPAPVIDFATVEVRNLSALTNGWSFGGTPGNYETVSNRAMRISLPGDDGHPGGVFSPYFNGRAQAATGARDLIKPGQSPDPGKLTLNQRYQEDGEGALTGVWWPAFLDAWNAWHWVASEDYVDEAINNIDIPDPSNYATKSELGDVAEEIEDVRTESALVYRLYSGSNVVAEVTNFNSAVHAPELRLMQLNESNEYFTVWAETNGLARTLNAATAYTDSATNALPATFAPRAWSRTTSGLGADAPADTTWISTPRTVVAGGLEYAKIVDTYGEVWVLASNGMAADFNPDTNAYFRITADDGTPVFSIEKSDAQVVGAYAEGITASANSVTMPVPVVSSTAPTMYWRHQLDSGDWSDQTTPPAGATVTWTGSAGSWVCTVTFGGARPPSMFFKFSFLQEGGVVIRNNATTDLSSGIWVNGTKFVPTVSGNNLIWTKQ